MRIQQQVLVPKSLLGLSQKETGRFCPATCVCWAPSTSSRPDSQPAVMERIDPQCQHVPALVAKLLASHWHHSKLEMNTLLAFCWHNRKNGG